MSHTSRRQLEKLEKLLSVNENQYRIVSQQINAHWSTYEENKKKTTRLIAVTSAFRKQFNSIFHILGLKCMYPLWKISTKR